MVEPSNHIMVTRKQERILEEAGEDMAHRPCLRDTHPPCSTSYPTPPPSAAALLEESLKGLIRAEPLRNTSKDQNMHFSSLGASHSSHVVRLLKRKTIRIWCDNFQSTVSPATEGQ